MSAEAKDQVRHEAKMLLNRWDEESDLDEKQIAKSVLEGVNEWLEEEIVEFDSDIDLGEEDDEEES